MCHIKLGFCIWTDTIPPQGGYCEVSRRELAFSQNPIRFVPRDWFVSDSLFPFPSSFPAKNLQMEGKLNYAIASFETLGKYFQIFPHRHLINIFTIWTIFSDFPSSLFDKYLVNISTSWQIFGKNLANI